MLLVSFSAIYISQATGYYEYEQYRNSVLTQEQIAKFEKDVEEGKNIDIDSYLTHDLPNYENHMSQLGLNISDGINHFVVEGIGDVFGFLNRMIED